MQYILVVYFILTSLKFQSPSLRLPIPLPSPLVCFLYLESVSVCCIHSLFLFFGFHVSDNVCYLSLSDISLSIRPSRSIHVVANSRISCFFNLVELYSIVCMYVYIYMYRFSYLSVGLLDGHLEKPVVLAIINNAALNIGVHVFFKN